MGDSVQLQCPVCRRVFAEPMRFCPEHGKPLAPLHTAVAPRRSSQGNGGPTGMVVGGKYRVLDRIGEGGMGSVYRVEHLELGRLMAMKLLHHELSAQEQAVVRFEREARSASMLVHPHIIRVWDSGRTPDGQLYLVMELLAGKDLFDVLRDEHHLSPERTINVARQICAALDEAHSHGIIHRDLKIENVFLATGCEFDDYVKILDFGIAKWLNTTAEDRTLTASGVVFGTPEYLSPEQAAGLEIDHRADLYSLGVIAYRMLAGALPFYDPDKQKLIQQQLHQLPLPFGERKMPQTVPVELEQVVFKLLAKDPDDRYQTAEEVKQALEVVAMADPIEWVDF